MPRRKSLTRRLIQHLLLISLARTILTAIGRGRAWDDWDERKLQTEPAEPRKHKRRFVQTLSFCAIFCAGLALSAGAGNGVYQLLEDGTTPAATGATGASGPSGATGVAGKTPAAQAVVRVVQAEPQAAPARPTVAPTRVTAKAAATAVSRPAVEPASRDREEGHRREDATHGLHWPSRRSRRRGREQQPEGARRSIPRSRRSRRRRCG